VDPLWAELINSDWHDYRGGGGREDRIENPKWLSDFLTRCGVAPRRLPDPKGRDALRRLRSVLRRSATALMAGGKPRKADLEAINRCLNVAPMTRRVAAEGSGYAVELVPRADGVRRVLGEAAASFAELLATGDPTRIKICANRDCSWVMYDESRNRTRRWCESTGCGNLIKVRRYRQRHRPTSGAGRTTRGTA
jgi:predicted RNA-binding Zn ribbon-like protein